MTDSPATATADLNLDPYWMPFTHNRYFKKHRPLDRLLVSAEGAYYTTSEGQKLFDGLSGLWCCGLGHRDPRIVDAVKKQLDVADYFPAFQVANPDAFRLAERIADHAPGELDHVFFTNSGSEAVDTALKIAHRLPPPAWRSVSAPGSSAASAATTASASAGSRWAASSPTARCSPPPCSGVDHLPHTHRPSEHGVLARHARVGRASCGRTGALIALHDASTIAAVIVEPMPAPRVC
jgi:beta-alanine--pyruvate transaminase